MHKLITVLLTVILVFQLCFAGNECLHDFWREISYGFTEHSRAEMLVQAYAQEHGLRYSDYPEELIALLDRNRRVLIGGDLVQDGPIYMFGDGRCLPAFPHAMDRLMALSAALTALGREEDAPC